MKIRKNTLYMGLFVVLAIVVFFIFTGGNTVSAGEVVKIPLSEISNEANFYDIEGIKFFAILGTDGKPRVAMDACDVCHSEKKGYRQEGDYMVCNNCGQKFHVNQLGEANVRGGGCWPGHLTSRVEGEFLIINTKEILKNKWRF